MTAPLRSSRPAVLAPKKKSVSEGLTSWAAREVAEALMAWQVMLVLGTFHGRFGAVPALSYWWTLLAVWTVTGLIAFGGAAAIRVGAVGK